MILTLKLLENFKLLRCGYDVCCVFAENSNKAEKCGQQEEMLPGSRSAC